MKARKHTLLIIDDSDDQRFFYQRAFAALDTKYNIKLAASGNQAIAYFKGEGKFANRKMFEFPSYVLTDLQMPDGDGFHVLQFIKENPALSIIPVVMLSTSDDADDIRQAYLLGASSFFVKPDAPRDLERLLKKIHDYWTECEVPEVDTEGYAVETNQRGRLGARYIKPQRQKAISISR